MPIYTRTGDKGKTSLFSGQRLSKADLRIDTLGTIDELNSTIGVVLSSKYQVLSIKKELIKIQKDLLEIGSALASLQGDALRSLGKRVAEFEDFIDQMTQHLPPLKNFILPGGGKVGAMLHLARAICRRAERRLVELFKDQRSKIKDQKADNLIAYFNRLSDLLFTMARFVNFKEKKKEFIWGKRII